MNNINILTGNKITPRDIFYFRQRQKSKVFHSVLASFVELAKSKGLTKKELAKRLNKDPAQLTRWFSGPGNWTLDTISDLLLAMGAEMKHEIVPINDGEQKSVTELPETLRNALAASGIPLMQYTYLPTDKGIQRGAEGFYIPVKQEEQIPTIFFKSRVAGARQ